MPASVVGFIVATLFGVSAVLGQGEEISNNTEALATWRPMSTLGAAAMVAAESVVWQDTGVHGPMLTAMVCRPKCPVGRGHGARPYLYPKFSRRPRKAGESYRDLQW